MAWKESYLDAIMVPLGVILLAGYHLRLYYVIRTRPLSTVIGVNHRNRRAWVYHIMKDQDRNGVLGVQTLRNSIMASTLLAGTAITLSSLIAALISGNATTYNSVVVLGGFSTTILAIKYLSLLCCFLAAFVCHVQAIRYASHASFLITVPVGKNAPGLTPEYVYGMIRRSSDFFSVGLRFYYFCFPLLLWIFGPVPMLVCCVVVIFLLLFVDRAKEFNLTWDHSNDIESLGDMEKKEKLSVDEKRKREEELMD